MCLAHGLRARCGARSASSFQAQVAAMPSSMSPHCVANDHAVRVCCFLQDKDLGTRQYLQDNKVRGFGSGLEGFLSSAGRLEGRSLPRVCCSHDVAGHPPRQGAARARCGQRAQRSARAT